MTQLEQPASEAEVFTLERVFAASPALLWDACTKPEHLGQWFGPPGTTVKVKTLDLKPGGVFLYGMEMPGGVVMWGKWVFREIDAPHRLAYVVSFCTEDGTPVRHPMAPLWPLEVLAVQTFEALPSSSEAVGQKENPPSSSEAVGQKTLDKTLMKSRSYPINATSEERAVFTAGHASMQMGFSGAWMQLDAWLARHKD
ncbi:SRPBCC domain-containing protein [Asticcacaulis sp. EMRT-3]|uniref:SRPBCC domain-containing protein n=1 Tax=Asticcacaulis sp. EMRT-3 TaxID=3040349 RepID=UPI0024AFACF2|nr:SRPBCC domain-containing protein [Asticcacaulis sp. EMRT-3]MDI7775553.1 SRPBCC domain-containing protein [Asticcacaulis sp. EMRT-3]